MSGERREHPRVPVSLAGEIETDAGRASIAITRDLSTSGVLILSRMELAIGSPVTLKVMFRDTAVVLTAKVVRNETVDPMLSSLWRFKVAAVIDPSPAFDQLMAELTPA
jgi:hypothetical protein